MKNFIKEGLGAQKRVMIYSSFVNSKNAGTYSNLEGFKSRIQTWILFSDITLYLLYLVIIII